MSEATDAGPRRLLAATVPPNVANVCAVLAAAGHQAVTVGGAVRDALLGRTPGDWDVATSATPDQVLALFPRTVPTGLAHGTVTVVTGRGEGSHVEVTTFRGEGAYTDARRPDSVTFGVPLVEDLARRDLVVNAIAYEPATGEIHDPFGGRADITAKRLRAVGDPVARFTEDGLRVMRAVRFAAVLQFTLDPATEAAIVPALPSLARVSRERVSDELRKLLAAPTPSLGLAIAARTGIIASILPALAIRDISDVDAWLARIDRAAPVARLAALLVPLAGPHSPRARDKAATAQAESILRALKFSNADSQLAAQLVGVWRAATEPSWSGAETRRLLAQLGRDRVPAAIALWRAEGEVATALVREAEAALATRAPLSTSDLAVTGNDLIADLGVPPGPHLGRLLAALLDRALADPSLNTREQLIALAKALRLELPIDP